MHFVDSMYVFSICTLHIFDAHADSGFIYLIGLVWEDIFSYELWDCLIWSDAGVDWMRFSKNSY